LLAFLPREHSEARLLKPSETYSLKVNHEFGKQKAARLRRTPK
jgi:hypothetical protein